MKIVALDFETANSNPCSPCSLGICVYEDGVISDFFEWYIRPHDDYCHFTNSHIHHIKYQDIKNCPTFDYYYPQLEKILDEAIIIAHNARFDLGVLNSTLDLYDLKHFLNPYLDTVTFARRFYPYLENHRLNTISEYLGLSFNHHNAQSDAYCCMMIVLKAMEINQDYDLDSLIKKVHLKLKHNV